MPSTTIKVSTELQEGLNLEARRANSTAAGVVLNLLAEHDRGLRFRAIREARSAMTAADRASYDVETPQWDAPHVSDLDDGVS